MPRVTLTIDGKTIKAEKGAPILDVCRENHITIPTLCHNPAVTSDGRCRLCMVEQRDGDWFKLVTSCLYPAKEGLTILTASDRVKKTRAMILELLLARCPTSTELQTLAAEYGVKTPRFDPDKDKGKCILCGLCTRTCAEVVGVNAIAFTERGIHKKVATPYLEPSAACIGCGACAFGCPTGHIVMWDKDGVRNIWGRKFEMAACAKCGRHFAPRYQLEHIARTTGGSMDRLSTCQDCR